MYSFYAIPTTIKFYLTRIRTTDSCRPLPFPVMDRPFDCCSLRSPWKQNMPKRLINIEAAWETVPVSRIFENHVFRRFNLVMRRSSPISAEIWPACRKGTEKGTARTSRNEKSSNLVVQSRECWCSNHTHTMCRIKLAFWPFIRHCD